jgi:hypothetical protein
MGDWLLRHVTIFGIHGQNWMLITFAIIVIWIALAWGQLAAFFNQAKPALSHVGLTMSVDGDTPNPYLTPCGAPP